MTTDPLEILTVRITKFQHEYLKAHKELTGNNSGEIIRLLLDYYISLNTGETNE